MMGMEVRFHLPGLRYNYPLNMFFTGLQSLHPEYFREGVKIASFFGEFPTSLWGGGRFCNDDQCDARFITEVVKNINKQGIPVRYTYTYGPIRCVPYPSPPDTRSPCRHQRLFWIGEERKRRRRTLPDASTIAHSNVE